MKYESCIENKADAEQIADKIAEKYHLTLRNTNRVIKSNTSYWIVKTSKKNRKLWYERRINLQKLILLDTVSFGNIQKFDDWYAETLNDKGYQHFQAHHMCCNPKCCNNKHIFPAFLSREWHKRMDFVCEEIQKGNVDIPVVKETIKKFPFLIL